MICPSCSKEATGLWRQAFTFQGVSLLRSVQGYLTCQHCGALLKVIMFKKQFRIFFTAVFIAVVLFTLNYLVYVPIFGYEHMAAVWIAIVVGSFCLFTFGIRKYSRVEKAE